MPGRPVPRAARSRPLGYEVAHARAQPVERRGDRSPGSVWTTSQVGFPGMPTWGEPGGRPRPGRWRPPAAACGCGACTCPNGRHPGDPHLGLQDRWLGRAARRRPRRGWRRPDGPDRPGRRLEHRPRGRATSGTWPSSRTAPTSARPSGRRSPRVVEAGLRRRRPPATPPGPACTPTGTTPQLRFATTRGHADRLRARLTGAGRTGERCSHRPRGAQGQGRQRPRAGRGGHRLIGTCRPLRGGYIGQTSGRVRSSVVRCPKSHGRRRRWL